MTKKSNGSWKPADDFWAQLQQDQVFLQQQLKAADAHATSVEQTRMALGPVIEALTRGGFTISDWAELLPRFAPLPDTAVAILLEYLAELDDSAAQEAVIRALGAAAGPFDARLLVEIFEKSTAESLRWAIANTLAAGTARGENLGLWLMGKVRDPSVGKAREMMLPALARLAPAALANPVLVEALNDMPGHSAMGLAISGAAGEAVALESYRTKARGWERKEIDKAVSAIRARLKGR
jgi:hypothetical protein